MKVLALVDRSLVKRITSVGGYIDERYDDDGLRSVLERWLGAARLADADPAVLITVYDLERRQAVLLRRDDDLSMVDGGVFAINPAALAYAEAGGQLDVLLSLGTGALTRPLPYDEVRGWGRLEWAEPILDVVFDGSADDLDDASAGNLAALAREAERLIAARDADIDRVCERLTA